MSPEGKISFLDKYLAKGKPMTQALEKAFPDFGTARRAVGKTAGDWLKPSGNLLEELSYMVGGDGTMMAEPNALLDYLSRTVSAPTMLDVGELGISQSLEHLQRSRPEATYPGAPAYTRRSLRGRIQ